MKKILILSILFFFSFIVMACSNRTVETPIDNDPIIDDTSDNDNNSNDETIIDDNSDDDSNDDADEDPNDEPIIDDSDEDPNDDAVDPGINPVDSKLTHVYDYFQTSTITDFSKLQNIGNEIITLGGKVMFITDGFFIISDGEVAIKVDTDNFYDDYKVGDVLEITGTLSGNFPNQNSFWPNQIRRINKDLEIANKPNEPISLYLSQIQNNYNLIGDVFRLKVYYNADTQTLYSPDSEDNFFFEIIVINIDEFTTLLSEYHQEVFEIDLVFISKISNNNTFIIEIPNIDLIDDEALKLEAIYNEFYAFFYQHPYFEVGEKVLDFELPFGAKVEWDFENIDLPSSISENTIDPNGIVLDNFSRIHWVMISGTLTYKDYTNTIFVNLRLIPNTPVQSIDAVKQLTHNEDVVIEGVVYENNFIYDGTNFIEFSHSSAININIGDTIKMFGQYTTFDKRISVSHIQSTDKHFDKPSNLTTVSVTDLISNTYETGTLARFEAYLVSGRSIDEFLYSYEFRDDDFNMITIRTDDKFMDYINEKISFNVLILHDGYVKILQNNLDLKTHNSDQIHLDLVAPFFKFNIIKRYDLSMPLPTKSLYDTALIWESTQPEILNHEGYLVGSVTEAVMVPYKLTIEKNDFFVTIDVMVEYFPTNPSTELTKKTGLVIDKQDYNWLVYDGSKIITLDLNQYVWRESSYNSLLPITASNSINIGDQIEFIISNYNETDSFHYPLVLNKLDEVTINAPKFKSTDTDMNTLKNLEVGQLIRLEGLLSSQNNMYFSFEDEYYIQFSLSASFDTNRLLSQLSKRYVSLDLLVLEIESNDDYALRYRVGVIGTPEKASHPLNTIIEDIMNHEWTVIGNQISLPNISESDYELTWLLPNDIDETGKLIASGLPFYSRNIDFRLSNDDWEGIRESVRVNYIDATKITKISEISRSNHNVSGVIFYVYENYLFIYDETGVFVINNTSSKSFNIGDTVVARGSVIIRSGQIPTMNTEIIVLYESTFELPSPFEVLNFMSAKELRLGDQFTLNDYMILRTIEEDELGHYLTFEDLNSSKTINIFSSNDLTDVELIENEVYQVHGLLLFVSLYYTEYYYITLDELVTIQK